MAVVSESLSVLDRLQLLGVLPTEGSFVTMNIVRDLRAALSFSEDELEVLKFVQAEGQVTWDNTVNLMKDVPMGKQARVILEANFKQMSSNEKLREDLLDIYARFVSE